MSNNDLKMPKNVLKNSDWQNGLRLCKNEITKSRRKQTKPWKNDWNNIYPTKKLCFWTNIKIKKVGAMPGQPLDRLENSALNYLKKPEIFFQKSLQISLSAVSHQAPRGAPRWPPPRTAAGRRAQPKAWFGVGPGWPIMGWALGGTS